MGYKRKKDSVHKKSLADKLENPATQGVRVYPHKKARKQPTEDADEEYIDTNQSSKILSLAKEQQQEQAREQAKAASAADIGTGTLPNIALYTYTCFNCNALVLLDRSWVLG